MNPLNSEEKPRLRRVSEDHVNAPYIQHLIYSLHVWPFPRTVKVYFLWAQFPTDYILQSCFLVSSFILIHSHFHTCASLMQQRLIYRTQPEIIILITAESFISLWERTASKPGPDVTEWATTNLWEMKFLFSHRHHKRWVMCFWKCCVEHVVIYEPFLRVWRKAGAEDGT